MSGSPSSLEARRYSAEELLSLRIFLPPNKSLVNQLNKHPDLACIVGHPDRTTKEPGRFSFESRGLADVTNSRRSQHMSRSQATDLSGESEYQTIRNSKNSRGEVRWNLRSRDTSDRSSQPHSAPSDLVAHQSENFQRFYRAVVSPTHVRVTAGGRIVPNTRTVAPPLFEWNPDKLHFENPKPQVDLGKPQLGSWLQGAPLPPPGFPHLLSPSGVVPQFFPRPMPMMASQAQPSAQGAQKSSVTGESTDTQQIKLSPPTQFDQTKPFMFNGHVVYPVPPGFQPSPSAVPMQMLGNPGFLPQHSMPSPAGFYPTQFPSPIPGMGSPFMFPPGHQLPMGMPNMIQPLENTPSMTPYLPMMSPMGPVSITDLIKTQLNGLQLTLKQIELQQASNNHQMDEAFVEHQRSMILGQISNMETMLETQLALERGSQMSTHGDEKKSVLGISLSKSHEKKDPSTTSSSAVDVKSLDSDSVAGGKAEFTKAQADFESTTTEKSKEEKKKAPVRSESTSKSRLTLAAAMAPPFQPRSHTAIAQASQLQLGNDIQRSGLTSPLEEAPFQTQAQIESRLLARSSTDWGYGPSIAANVTIPRAPSAYVVHTQSQTGGQAPALRQHNTFHGQTNASPHYQQPIVAGVQPYLVGSLAAGVNIHQARPSDVTYNRDLTVEELQARHLYWGKAPRSVMKGLPKFDGKDFYPASPVKQEARLASAAPSLSSAESQALVATAPDVNFENMFDSPVQSPQHTSAGRAATGSNTVQQPSVKNPDHGYGYGSSSFAPPASGLAGWSNFQTPPRPNGTDTDTYATPPVAGKDDFSHLFLEEEGPTGTDLTTTPVKVKDDFSHLFLERGVPGYESPSPFRQGMSAARVKFENEPVTPTNKGSPNEAERAFNTGSPFARDNGNAANESADLDETSSTTSTVEIHTTIPPNQNHGSDRETTFAERMESCRSSSEQQTLFLQNMLRNTTQSQMSAPALSGTISPALAQGYLPQYRGSAAASLAPSVINVPAGDRDIERYLADFPRSPAVAVTPLSTTNFSENRPFIGNRFHRSTQQSAENMGAEGYMRYISQKDDDDKKAAEKIFNNEETVTGPVSKSAAY